MEANLAVLKGGKDEKDVTITCVPFDVGRCRTANFIIPHMNVSRKHCQIVKENGLWKVSDWSSSGTFINDVLVGKGKFAILNHGDSIRFGPAESDLFWTFKLLTSESSTENCEVEAQMLLKLGSEKEQFQEWKIDYLKKNLSEIKSNGRDSESRNKEILELKDDSEKIQELQRELRQIQNALNNIEEQNTALQEKLVSEMKNKTTDLTAKILQNLTDLMESELQCTICSELFVTAITLCCSHTFCKYCIDQWKKKQKTCPICRKKITKETRSLVVDNYIDRMIGNLSLELKERRNIIMKQRTIVPIKKCKRVN